MIPLDRPELATNYIVDTGINFGAVGEEEIYQNVKYALLTEYFSVVIDRELGMNFTMVDKPPEVAKLMLEQECAMKISLYEPRAQFASIDYIVDETMTEPKKLKPYVKVHLLATTSIEKVPLWESLPELEGGLPI